MEDPDDTLKRKVRVCVSRRVRVSSNVFACVCVCLQTLDLLYQMTNPVNVEVIVDKQLFYLRTATDEYLRSDLVTRIR